MKRVELVELIEFNFIIILFYLHSSLMNFFLLLTTFPLHLTAYIYFSTGDITQRLCTAAELRLFFSSFRTKELTSGVTFTYIKPNKNCNLNSWASGCEPGWSCSLGKNKVDPKTTDVPSRTENCQSCCEGFFCPQGLTCMIRKFVIKLPLVIFLPS